MQVPTQVPRTWSVSPTVASSIPVCSALYTIPVAKFFALQGGCRAIPAAAGAAAAANRVGVRAIAPSAAHARREHVRVFIQEPPPRRRPAVEGPFGDALGPVDNPTADLDPRETPKPFRPHPIHPGSVPLLLGCYSKPHIRRSAGRPPHALGSKRSRSAHPPQRRRTWGPRQ